MGSLSLGTMIITVEPRGGHSPLGRMILTNQGEGGQSFVFRKNDK